MKLLSALVLTLLAFTTLGFADGWTERFENAQAQAKRENKPLLVDFTGSDWCPWCIKLESEVFRKAQFKAFAKDYVLVKVDFPQRKPLSEKQEKVNVALAEKYKVKSFPTVFVMDAAGRKFRRVEYTDGGADVFIKETEKAKAKL